MYKYMNTCWSCSFGRNSQCLMDADCKHRACIHCYMVCKNCDKTVCLECTTRCTICYTLQCCIKTYYKN